MNSIDNLREYVLTAPSVCSTTRAILVGYIDNIERDAADMVPLPLDADGEPIHVGDVMDEQLPFGGYAAPAPVDTMELSRGAGGYGWMVRLDSESGAFINPKLLRHHHAPTVEDVLREFAYGLGVPVADSYVAATAVKLRLAEDNDGLYDWERDE